MEVSGIIRDRLRLSVSTRGAACRPQTNDAIWDGVIGLWGRVAPLLSPWCARAGSGSCIPWHSDNESLFGPPNQPTLIVSMSLGHSVCDVPSSITLDHGDVLVMDGSAQSEYAHRTVPGLQGPWVNLTYRWVTQHAASCPLAGVVGCVLPTCVQGLFSRAKFPLVGDGGEQFVLFFGIGLLFVNPGVFPGQHLDSHKEGASSQLSASIPPGGVPPLAGSCSLGRGTTLATCHDAANLPKERLCISA